jgi:hypothetical protein
MNATHCVLFLCSGNYYHSIDDMDCAEPAEALMLLESEVRALV